MNTMNHLQKAVELTPHRLFVFCCALGIILMSALPAVSSSGQSVSEEASTQQAMVRPEEPLPAPAGDTPGGAPALPPSTSLAELNKIREDLLKENFTYLASNMTDPFISFIKPAITNAPQFLENGEEGDLPPQPQKPLTPLQKMSLGEVEKGLKCIMWGEMGRRAIIEDAGRKGYIVTIGTPVGDNNGIIKEIFEDRLIIQQEIWDRQAGRLIPQNAVVRLKKEEKS